MYAKATTSKADRFRPTSQTPLALDHMLEAQSTNQGQPVVFEDTFTSDRGSCRRQSLPFLRF